MRPLPRRVNDLPPRGSRQGIRPHAWQPRRRESPAGFGHRASRTTGRRTGRRPERDHVAPSRRAPRAPPPCDTSQARECYLAWPMGQATGNAGISAPASPCRPSAPVSGHRWRYRRSGRRVVNHASVLFAPDAVFRVPVVAAKPCRVVNDAAPISGTGSPRAGGRNWQGPGGKRN